MICLNFGCTQAATPPYPCCDNSCGYQHRGNVGQIKKYEDGIINWRYLKEGIMHYWSIEKCEYYHSLINK